MTPELLLMLDNFDSYITVVSSVYAYAEMKPQTKQSTNFGRGRAWTSPKKRKYLSDLADCLREDLTDGFISGRIRLTVLYCFPWRQSDKKLQRQLGWALMDKRPDTDNLTKPLCDALQSVALHDDAQVVEIRARKIRVDTPCIALRLDQITESK